MMQPSLFSQRQLGKLARPKEKQQKKERVYGVSDVFPFGRFKGRKLEDLARIAPDHLNWWQQTSNVQFTKALHLLIYQSKLNAL